MLFQTCHRRNQSPGGDFRCCCDAVHPISHFFPGTQCFHKNSRSALGRKKRGEFRRCPSRCLLSHEPTLGPHEYGSNDASCSREARRRQLACFMLEDDCSFDADIAVPASPGTSLLTRWRPKTGNNGITVRANEIIALSPRHLYQAGVFNPMTVGCGGVVLFVAIGLAWLFSISRRR